ncbi:MAG: anti-sigma factor, partial [Pseudomonadota bacterium]|nr:anti-sigma factor [Pseudomonadota bacterium]
MSDEGTMTDGDHIAPDVTAAELALGLLEGDDRSAALRRVLADRAFAADVDRWRTYLSQLFDLWPESSVSDDVFARVEGSLDAPASVPARHGRAWPAVAALTSVAAAVLLVILIARPVPT